MASAKILILSHLSRPLNNSRHLILIAVSSPSWWKVSECSIFNSYPANVVMKMRNEALILFDLIFFQTTSTIGFLNSPHDRRFVKDRLEFQ